jgi:uncharacterized protein with von Willebrand factor type A (vWA) domain
MKPMPILPRPASPRSAFEDLRGYLFERRAHKWPLLGLSAAITWVIIWAFLVDANTNTMPKRNQIFYVQSWKADRSDTAVILQQKLDLAERELLLRKKQKEMQKVADTFKIPWRDEAELDRRLAAAQAKEQQAGGVTDMPRSVSASMVPPASAKPK